MKNLNETRSDLVQVLTCPQSLRYRHHVATDTLPGLGTHEEMLGHPISGASLEGLVTKTVHSTIPEGTTVNFCRSSVGVEIDLVLMLTHGHRSDIEIKWSLSPKVERGLHHTCADLEPECRIVVYPGTEAFH